MIDRIDVNPLATLNVMKAKVQYEDALSCIYELKQLDLP